METLRVEELCRLLKSIWLDTKPIVKQDKKEILDTYARYFKKLDYVPMKGAIDELQFTSNYIPQFPELDIAYRNNLKPVTFKQGEIECWVCLDRGYVLYDLKVSEGYDQTVLYCTECNKGRFESGELFIDKDGYETSTKPKYKNRTAPVSRYLNVGDLISNNQKKYKGNGWTRDNTREVYFRSKKWDFNEEAKQIYKTMMENAGKIGEGIGKEM